MISECLYLSGLCNWVIWKADSLRCALKEVERTRKWFFIFVQTRLPQNGRAGREVKFPISPKISFHTSVLAKVYYTNENFGHKQIGAHEYQKIN